MHPEVRQEGPGSCPDCGMALEPLVAAPASRVEYTCPMHPEILQVHPGSCPICGMALEPRTVAVEAGPIRRLVLAHGILSFFFNTVILALAINNVAGVL